MNLIELAHRIRALRLERQMTLEEVAARADQTRSWLSKVENSRITPSLSALAKVAYALGTPIADLLAGLDYKPDADVVREDERALLSLSKVEGPTCHAITRSQPSHNLHPLALKFEPGQSLEAPFSRHGEEWLMVLEGVLTLRYGGKDIQLLEGDSVHFTTAVRHVLTNDGDVPSYAVCVLQSAVRKDFF